jgi:hypothetical protein
MVLYLVLPHVVGTWATMRVPKKATGVSLKSPTGRVLRKI